MWRLHSSVTSLATLACLGQSCALLFLPALVIPFYLSVSCSNATGIILSLLSWLCLLALTSHFWQMPGSTGSLSTMCSTPHCWGCWFISAADSSAASSSTQGFPDTGWSWCGSRRQVSAFCPFHTSPFPNSEIVPLWGKGIMDRSSPWWWWIVSPSF